MLVVDMEWPDSPSGTRLGSRIFFRSFWAVAMLCYAATLGPKFAPHLLAELELEKYVLKRLKYSVSLCRIYARLQNKR